MADEDDLAQLVNGMAGAAIKNLAANAPRLSCSACGLSTARLRQCGGQCGGVARYCDAACAAADWKRHKRVCGKKTTGEAASAPGRAPGARALLHAACDAVRAGDSAALASLLEQGAPVALRTNRSYADWPHCALLHICCFFAHSVAAGRLACLRLVLAAPGVDIDARCGDPDAPPGVQNTRETPLMIAALYLPAAVPLLLERGARPDLVDWCGRSAAALVDKSTHASAAEKAALRQALAEAQARRAGGAAGRQAEALREEGNAAFRARDWDVAAAKYSASLEALVDPRTVSNLAATHIRRAVAIAAATPPQAAFDPATGRVHVPEDEEAAERVRATAEAWLTGTRLERAAWDEALRFATQARELSPGCPKAHYRCARAQAGRHDLPRALLAAREGLKACPGESALTQLAASLVALGVRDDGCVARRTPQTWRAPKPC